MPRPSNPGSNGNHGGNHGNGNKPETVTPEVPVQPEVKPDVTLPQIGIVRPRCNEIGQIPPSERFD